jgi:hypothetical protein
MHLIIVKYLKEKSKSKSIKTNKDIIIKKSKLSDIRLKKREFSLKIEELKKNISIVNKNKEIFKNNTEILK